MREERELRKDIISPSSLVTTCEANSWKNQTIVSPKVTDGSNELVSALSRMLGIKHFGRKVVKQCILPKQT